MWCATNRTSLSNHARPVPFCRKYRTMNVPIDIQLIRYSLSIDQHLRNSLCNMGKHCEKYEVGRRTCGRVIKTALIKCSVARKAIAYVCVSWDDSDLEYWVQVIMYNRTSTSHHSDFALPAGIAMHTKAPMTIWNLWISRLCKIIDKRLFICCTDAIKLYSLKYIIEFQALKSNNTTNNSSSLFIDSYQVYTFSSKSN